MQGSSLLTEISLSYNQYTKTERKIADYILKKPGGVLFMSITELAEECGVAEASIHRFCRKVGAKGYQEFKMKLSLSTMPEEPESDEGAADGSGKVATGQMFADILQTHINAIRETNALLRPETVNAAVDLMIRSRSVQFFGIGDSLLAAEEARNKFLRITPKVRTITDPRAPSRIRTCRPWRHPWQMQKTCCFSYPTRERRRIMSMWRRSQRRPGRGSL